MKASVNFQEISVYQGPEVSPGFLLWQMSTAWRSSLEVILKQFGLTHPQFVVLASLGWMTRNRELVTQAAIGKMVCLDPNTTSQIIKGLEKKKLVKRLQSEDRRVKHPIVTPKGKAILVKALPAVEEQDAKFFRSLKLKEMNVFVRTLQMLSPRA